MLLIDKVQKTAEEVAEMFDLPFDKIRQRPEFEINPTDIIVKLGQSKEISSKAGTQVPALIIVKWKGKSIEVRYAENINETLVGDKMIPQYDPRKVAFLGEMMLVDEENLDLAVFLYLHPYNKTSPVRTQFKMAKFSWAFKDVEQEGIEEMEENDELMNALVEIKDLEGEPLKIVAKGLGHTNIDNLTDKSIQALLVKTAKVNPKDFNTKIDSQQLQFRGLILNGIDRGLFVEKTFNGRQRWTWGIGDEAGQSIVDINENGNSHADTLVEFILNNILKYYPRIMSSQKNLMALQNSESFFDNNKMDLKSMFSGEVESQFGGSSNERSFDDGRVNPNTIKEDNDKFKDDFDPGKDLDIDEDFEPGSASDDFPDKLDLDDKNEEEFKVPDFLKKKEEAKPAAPARKPGPRK